MSSGHSSQNKNVLRTPDHYFNDLPDFPFSPHYLDIPDPDFGSLRMHYIDEGQGADNQPVVLMLHGEPSWCFLYRKLINPITQAGYRAIAPDHIGFGRSDKLPQRSDYSYQRYVDWLTAFIEQLDLHNIVLVCQDWGGPIGLRALSQLSDRFSAIVITNTVLPTCQLPPLGVDNWPGEIIENWVGITQQANDLPVAEIVNGVCATPLSADIKAAYDAPFPDASYKAAVLEFPNLIPIHQTMAGVAENRETWKVLEQWHKPVITCFSDSDPSTKAWESVFQQRIPGASHQAHSEIQNAGHFVQEDQGEQLAEVILKLLKQLSSG